MFDGQPVAMAAVVDSGEGWVATLVATRGVDLTLTADGLTVEAVFLDLWSRPADDGVGVAVVADRGEPRGLAVIPICECGEQGCANAGRQVNEWVDSVRVLELIELVSRLPVLGMLEPDQELWHPEDAPSGTRP